MLSIMMLTFALEKHFPEFLLEQILGKFHNPHLCQCCIHIFIVMIITFTKQSIFWFSWTYFDHLMYVQFASCVQGVYLTLFWRKIKYQNIAFSKIVHPNYLMMKCSPFAANCLVSNIFRVWSV